MRGLKIHRGALKVLGIILIGIFLFIALLLFLEPVLYEVGEYGYYEGSYPTYDAAADALPQSKFMPTSATDIRYMGLFEEPEMWLFFNFDPKEISEIRKRCDRVTVGEVELAPYGGPGDFFDWPNKITGTVRAEDIAGYEIYKCKIRRFSLYRRFREGVLAVEAEKGKAYYWGP
jgi:hypothetical protein